MNDPNEPEAPDEMETETEDIESRSVELEERQTGERWIAAGAFSMRIFPDVGPKGEIAQIYYRISAKRKEVAAYIFVADDGESMNVFANQKLSKQYQKRSSFKPEHLNVLIDRIRENILDRDLPEPTTTETEDDIS